MATKAEERYNRYGEDLTKRSAFGKVICAGPQRFRAVSYGQQIRRIASVDFSDSIHG